MTSKRTWSLGWRRNGTPLAVHFCSYVSENPTHADLKFIFIFDLGFMLGFGPAGSNIKYYRFGTSLGFDPQVPTT